MARTLPHAPTLEGIKRKLAIFATLPLLALGLMGCTDDKDSGTPGEETVITEQHSDDVAADNDEEIVIDDDEN